MLKGVREGGAAEAEKVWMEHNREAAAHIEACRRYGAAMTASRELLRRWEGAIELVAKVNPPPLPPPPHPHPRALLTSYWPAKPRTPRAPGAAFPVPAGRLRG